MKRFVAVAICLSMVVAVVALAAGCGGNNAQAKQDTQQAEQLLKQIDTQGNALGGEVTQAFSSVTSAASFNAAVTQVKATISKLTDSINQAKAKFQKIKQSANAGNYSKYSDLQLKVLGYEDQLAQEVNSFLDQAAAIVNSPTGSADQLKSLQTTFTTKVNDLGAKVTQAQKAASAFKTQKGL
jgi:chromosome segregation ATPase